ncbi:MAG: fatty acid desaturase [Alphaproteobacteria bacterium]|nr:fatty acid desaturase [Alphaproteobacteria bacterium]
MPPAPAVAASPSTVWRAHTGQLAWPTIALATVSCGGWAALVVGHVLGVVPTAVVVPVNALLVYVAFTPLHEATHGNVGGKGRAWVDTVVGWVTAAVLLSPFPAFRALHLQHHAHTNDPDEDPDIHVAGDGPRVAVAAVLTLVQYEWTYWTHIVWAVPKARAELPAAVLGLSVLTVGWGALALTGHADTLVWAIGVPAWVATTALALAFDWLPHRPHSARGRFVDTRALPQRWLDVPLLGQNLHAVHHAWPRVPWYRYRAVYEATEAWMVAQGMPVGWRAPMGTATRAGDEAITPAPASPADH